MVAITTADNRLFPISYSQETTNKKAQFPDLLGVEAVGEEVEETAGLAEHQNAVTPRGEAVHEAHRHSELVRRADEARARDARGQRHHHAPLATPPLHLFLAGPVHHGARRSSCHRRCPVARRSAAAASAEPGAIVVANAAAIFSIFSAAATAVIVVARRRDEQGVVAKLLEVGDGGERGLAFGAEHGRDLGSFQVGLVGRALRLTAGEEGQCFGESSRKKKYEENVVSRSEKALCLRGLRKRNDATVHAFDDTPSGKSLLLDNQATASSSQHFHLRPTQRTSSCFGGSSGTTAPPDGAAPVPSPTAVASPNSPRPDSIRCDDDGDRSCRAELESESESGFGCACWCGLGAGAGAASLRLAFVRWRMRPDRRRRSSLARAWPAVRSARVASRCRARSIGSANRT